MHPFLIFFIAIDFLCLGLHDDVIGNHCEPDKCLNTKYPIIQSLWVVKNEANLSQVFERSFWVVLRLVRMSRELVTSI